MTTITIRNVSKETHDELVRRAALKGQSLQEYLRAWLSRETEQLDMDTLMERIRERKRKSKYSPSVEEILAARDADRR